MYSQSQERSSTKNKKNSPEEVGDVLRVLSQGIIVERAAGQRQLCSLGGQRLQNLGVAVSLVDSAAYDGLI